MGSLEKIEVTGKEKEKILKNAFRKSKEWGIELPEVFAPLVLDFGLGSFSKTGHIEYWIANDEEQGYCGKFILMFKGQTCPAHYHKRKHETFMVIKGNILMHIGNADIAPVRGRRSIVSALPTASKSKRLEMKPGDVLPMPQNSLHSFTALRDALILEVSRPSVLGDNFFRNRKIGVDSVKSSIK